MAKTRTEPMVVDISDGEDQGQIPTGIDGEPAKLYGRLTITFWDMGSLVGAPSIAPEVRFHPVGRISPETINKNLEYIFNQILIAQAQARVPIRSGPRLEQLAVDGATP
jgi:hypothetical protein